MKKIIALFALFALFAVEKVNAQQSNHLDSNATFGAWTNWIPDTVKGDDGTLYTWEYRYTVSKRKGLAVTYVFEIKNTCAQKLEGRIHFTYTDLLIKGPASGDSKFKVKPGETTSVEFIEQGCRKKDKKKDDYKSCFDCPVNYTFYINTR